VLAAVAALVIAIPSDLIDTPWFGRPVAVRPIDYVILVVTAGLIGLVLAIHPDPASDAVSDAAEADERRTVWAGFASFLAVGCPVCNQAVVALVGTSGALSWWAPVQPIVGLAAIGLLLHALRRRLDTYDLAACPVPA
jgi:hypothetical protein